MKTLLLISLIFIPACTRIAHISDSGEIVVDRPDLYSDTAQAHEIEHLQELGHCWNPACVMFFDHSFFAPIYNGSTELCSKCEIKLKRIKNRRPTTLDWLKDIEIK